MKSIISIGIRWFLTIVLFAFTYVVAGVLLKLFNIGEWGILFWLIEGIFPTYAAIYVARSYSPNETIGVLVFVVICGLIGVTFIVSWFLLNLDVSVLIHGIGIILGSAFALFSK